MVITKVFFEWWGICNLNVGKKIQMIYVAFAYMGKPAGFNRIIGKYPNLDILLEYARSNISPALTGGNGVILTNKTVVLENPDTLHLEYVRTGQITATDYEMIHCLSMVTRMEHDYINICDSLGCHWNMGPWLYLNTACVCHKQRWH